MKQMKFFLVVLMVALMGVSVTSCLKGDNKPAFDLGIAARVVSQGLEVCLVDNETGNIYYVENPGVLKPQNAVDYPERVLVYLKYVEGVTAESAKKKVTIVNGTIVNTHPLCTRPDTIKVNAPLAALEETAVLGQTSLGMLNDAPAYCDILFKLYKEHPTVATSVELVPVDAKDDVLTLELKQTSAARETYNEIQHLVAFKLPSLGVINTVLDNMTEEGKEAPVLTPVDGKIKIKLIAKGRDDKKLELEPTKEFKISNY